MLHELATPVNAACNGSETQRGNGKQRSQLEACSRLAHPAQYRQTFHNVLVDLADYVYTHHGTLHV